jgi:hypothetical protein
MTNWHQANAIRTNYRNRKKAAHIVDNSRYGFFALCGESYPIVTVNKEYADNLENGTCKKCLKKLQSER